MVGFFVGAVSGGVQFWMLSLFTKALTSGSFNKSGIILAVFQFFLPLLVLLGFALLRPDYLIWTGAGMAAVLLACALVKFILYNRK